MRRITKCVLLSVVIGLGGAVPSPEAAGIRDGYPSPEEIQREMSRLASDVPGASVLGYGTSLEGRPLTALRIARGNGDAEARPALLVVAGVEPERLQAAEIALAIGRHAGRRPDAGPDPLEKAVLYVIPDANPDGRARVLRGYAGAGNARPVDDDHDDATDEDGTDDMDGDGHIRWMRVYRTGGAWRPDSADARASVKADPDKGKVGLFDLVPEGKDDDGDGQVNEDGPGGVSINANFPHAYKDFGVASGVHPVSEPESKALADFVLAHPHIGATLVFASDDVLTEAPKPAMKEDKPIEAGLGPPLPAGLDPEIQALLRDRTVAKGILKADIAPYERAAGRYRALVGIGKEKAPPETSGTLGDWLRYQQGTFSLVTPGWTFADSNGAPGDEKPAGDGDSTSVEKKEKKKSPPAPDELRAIRYLEATGRDGFTPWKEATHPAFPGKKVEIGGLDPLVFLVPPRSELDTLGARHARFVREIMGWLPSITLEDVTVDRLEGGACRLRAGLVNTGYLPVALHQGVKSRKARPVRVDLVLPGGGEILAGRAVTLVRTIAGSGGRHDLEWVIQAPAGSRAVIRAASPRSGSVESEVRLP